jgi:hypothetical protein
MTSPLTKKQWGWSQYKKNSERKTLDGNTHKYLRDRLGFDWSHDRCRAICNRLDDVLG